MSDRFTINQRGVDLLKRYRDQEARTAPSVEPNLDALLDDTFFVRLRAKTLTKVGEKAFFYLMEYVDDAWSATTEEIEAIPAFLGMEQNVEGFAIIIEGEYFILILDLTTVPDYDESIKQAFGHDTNGDAIWIDADGDCDE